jgi:hypothetical protein
MSAFVNRPAAWPTRGRKRPMLEVPIPIFISSVCFTVDVVEWAKLFTDAGYFFVTTLVKRESKRNHAIAARLAFC